MREVHHCSSPTEGISGSNSFLFFSGLSFFLPLLETTRIQSASYKGVLFHSAYLEAQGPLLHYGTSKSVIRTFSEILGAIYSTFSLQICGNLKQISNLMPFIGYYILFLSWLYKITRYKKNTYVSEHPCYYISFFSVFLALYNMWSDIAKRPECAFLLLALFYSKCKTFSSAQTITCPPFASPRMQFPVSFTYNKVKG